jgi:TRAP-type C4-dicarboxylate transport system permease small subunit
MSKDRLQLPTGQRLLRIFGGIVLSACAVMVVLGVTVLEDDLQGPLFALYWSWCFLFAILAILVALWDMILVRRAFKRRRRELFREEFMTEEFVAKIRDAIRKDEKQ